MITYQSATFVAKYLGVSTGSVHNWTMNPPDGFPEPDCEIYGVGGKITARGWIPERMPSLRTWYAKRLELEPEDAEAHWLLVDAAMTRETRKASIPVPVGQMAIEMPLFENAKDGVAEPVTTEETGAQPA